MASKKMDMFCIALILILIIYNIAICFDFKNGNYKNLSINITSDDFFSLILSKYSQLKVLYLSHFVVSAFNLMQSMEPLPGPEVKEHFSNTRGIKIINENVTELFTNIESLTLL